MQRGGWAASVVVAALHVASPAAADPAIVARAVTGGAAFTAQDDTRACALRADGSIAVATGGGLVLVGPDGTARALTALDGLPDTRVHAVAEQGSGLWVGTEGGAAYVEGAPPRVVRTALTAPVQAVFVDAAGVVALGTRGSGVFRLATRDATPERLPGRVKGTRVTALAEAGGRLHVAHADGPLAAMVDGALVDVAGSPTHGQALATVGGELVLGDLTGVHRGGATAIASVDARGLAAAPVAGAPLLVATWGSGLMQGTTRGALRPVPGVPAHVRGVAARGGRRCAATTEGLFVDDGAGFRPRRLGGPTSNDVTALAVDGSGQRVAIGTFEDGLTVRDGPVLARPAGVEARETVNAALWHGDVLWVGTARGLVRTGGGAPRRFTVDDGLPSPIVRAVHVTASGRIVVGTDRGPAVLTGDRVTPLAATPKSGRAPLASPMHAVWALTSGPDDTLYIGTTTGLYAGKDGRFRRLSLASGALRDDWVTALALAGDTLWVGTYAKGVTRLALGGADPVATHLGGGYVNAGGIVLRAGTVHVATMEHLLARPADDDTAAWTSLRGAATGRDVTQIAHVGSETWVASRRGVAIHRGRPW